MALFGNGVIGGSIRTREVHFEVESSPGEETTDEGKIKRVASLPELRS
ncbi:hypothetical protein MPC4_220010 [Methylocella tundrae]|uniref:Uncharacterized protein n=1 Tax=Methylocella tundrae TaxID=227605 RepID=A0A8B6M7J5_METTU|nr:hypothetical protein MPC1_2590004 [Methylocella tundrae]VTZ50280.1 hypothetical protein MPC4_220010 [Methylocella tundrae]